MDKRVKIFCNTYDGECTVPHVTPMEVKQLNREVNYLYNQLSKEEQDYLCTEFQNTVETAPHFSANMLCRLYFIEPTVGNPLSVKGVLDIYGNDEKPFVSIAVSPLARKQGVASSLLNVARSMFNLNYTVSSKNTPSLALVRKHGFKTKHGIIPKDHYRYIIPKTFKF